jgi:hypothetical protein
MSDVRKIKSVLRSRPTMEGAGVRLKRAFGHSEVPLLDPFLLLDDFGSDNPDEYMAGFPWHPHRGIETVTYMLRGQVEHGDSIGNQGVIQSGDVQWMTAGSGIIHQEMPREYEGYMRGFQLWVNLPSSHKMMDPRYRGVKNEQIPVVLLEDDVRMRVICGKMGGVEGPVHDLVVDAEYYDITVSPYAEFEKRVKSDYTAFAYVIEGNGYFDPDRAQAFGNGHLVVFYPGDMVRTIAGDEAFRFLFVAGEPLNEPIAWGGPIVMNTQEELQLAFQEYRNGTFIKHGR